MVILTDKAIVQILNVLVDFYKPKEFNYFKFLGNVSMVCKHWYNDIIPQMKIHQVETINHTEVKKFQSMAKKDGAKLMYFMFQPEKIDNLDFVQAQVESFYFSDISPLPTFTGKMPYLKDLNVTVKVTTQLNEMLGNEGLKSLKSLTISKPERLTRFNLPVDLPNLSNLAANLTTLYFDDYIELENMEFLKQFEKLDELKLSVLPKASASLVTLLKDLKNLKIGNFFMITKTSEKEDFSELFEFLCGQNQIRDLIICNGSIPFQKIVDGVNKNTSIKHLQFRDCEFGSYSPAQTITNNTLVTCILEQHPIHQNWKTPSNLSKIYFYKIEAVFTADYFKKIHPKCASVIIVQNASEDSKLLCDLIKCNKKNFTYLEVRQPTRFSYGDNVDKINTKYVTSVFKAIDSNKFLGEVDIQIPTDYKVVESFLTSKHKTVYKLTVDNLKVFSMPKITKALLSNKTLKSIRLKYMNNDKRETYSEYIDGLCAIINGNHNLTTIAIDGPELSGSALPKDLEKFKTTIEKNHQFLNYLDVYETDFSAISYKHNISRY
ncbi:hypothetical protein DLAC_09929 [Tieghemostelium lacteum]|uniref:F-box domain-containing protein n=1 Tax=Tieghemostelium lacteum TaxID=361077 RepID=A0A151Z5N8_TIELA|nr:hypothetical protein DLAC_09929 [Tieghemostelium lacteum]|eukprot:KYQ89270.1 hypothetical protein DLAC_09929 [Tieghemostelium lacteum]